MAKNRGYFCRMIVFVILFALLSFSFIVQAEEPPAMSVNGIAVTSLNSDDVLGDADGSAKSVRYDLASNTLTFDNANITADALYLIELPFTGINVELIGDNVFTAAEKDAVKQQYGSDIPGDIAFKGMAGSTLSITADTAFSLYGNVTFEGSCAITLTGSSNPAYEYGGYPIYTYYNNGHGTATFKDAVTFESTGFGGYSANVAILGDASVTANAIKRGISGAVSLTDASDLTVSATEGAGISGSLEMNSSGNVNLKGGDAVNNDLGYSFSGLSGTLIQSDGIVSVTGGSHDENSEGLTSPAPGISSSYSNEDLEYAIDMTGGVLNVYGADGVGLTQYYVQGPTGELIPYDVGAVSSGISYYSQKIRIAGDAVLNVESGDPGTDFYNDSRIDSLDSSVAAINCGELIVDGSASVNATAHSGVGIKANVVMDSSGEINALGGIGYDKDSTSYYSSASPHGVYGNVTQSSGTIIATGGSATSPNYISGAGVYTIDNYSDPTQRVEVILTGGELNATAGDSFSGYAFSGIEAYSHLSDSFVTASGNSTINATGGDIVSEVLHTQSYNVGSGIYTKVAVFSGTSNITANAGNITKSIPSMNGNFGHGIYAHTSMTVNDSANVTAKGGSGINLHMVGYGIHSSVTMNSSGTLTAISGRNEGADVYGTYGIYGGLIINDGNVVVRAGNSDYSPAIYIIGDVTEMFQINGGELLAVGGIASGGTKSAALPALPKYPSASGIIINAFIGESENDLSSVSSLSSDILFAPVVKLTTVAVSSNSYGLVVSGVTVTEQNKDNIPVVSGSAVYTPSANAEPALLTLTNAVIELSSDIPTIALERKVGDLKVILIGNNTVTNTGSGAAFSDLFGNNINFSGSGSLTVNGNGTSAAMQLSDFSLNDSIIVTVNGGDEGGDGIIGDLTVNGDANITVHGGVSTEIDTHAGDAMTGHLTMNGTGIVTLNGGTAKSGAGGVGLYGGIIQTDGKVVVNGGDAVDGLQPGEELVQLSQASAAVKLVPGESNISGGTLIANGGSVVSATRSNVQGYSGIDITLSSAQPVVLIVSGTGRVESTGGDVYSDEELNNSYVRSGSGIWVDVLTITDNGYVVAKGGSINITNGVNTQNYPGGGVVAYSSRNFSVSDTGTLIAEGGSSNEFVTESTNSAYRFFGIGVAADLEINGGYVSATGGACTAPNSIGSVGNFGSVVMADGIFSSTGGDGMLKGGHASEYNSVDLIYNPDSMEISGGIVSLIGGKNSSGVHAAALPSYITPDVSMYTNPAPTYLYGATETEAIASGAQSAPTFGETFLHGYFAIKADLPISPDVNGDGVVNFIDLTVIRNNNNFGKSIYQSTNRSADVNGDGIINEEDARAVYSHADYNN